MGVGKWIDNGGGEREREMEMGLGDGVRGAVGSFCVKIDLEV